METNQKNKDNILYSLLSRHLPMNELEEFVNRLEPDEMLQSKVEVPSYWATRWCLATLAEIGYEYVNPTLRAWLYNLQLGNTGFSEWPGEMAWCYTTFDVSFAYKYLDLQPQKKDGFINYVKSFQNIDGGYSTLGGLSDIYGTIRWTTALINIGEKNIAKETISFLRKVVFENKLKCEDLYYALTILDNTETITKEERRRMFGHIYKYLLKNIEQLNIIQKYWFCETLKLLVPSFDLGFLNAVVHIDWNVSGPFSIYVATRLSLLFKIPFDKYIVEKKIFAHVCRGGFEGSTNVDLYTYAIAKQIFPLSHEESNRFCQKLNKYILKENKLRSEVVFSLDPKANYRLIKAYLLMGGTIKQENIKNFIIDQLAQNLQKRNLMDAYHTLATLKMLELKFPNSLKEELLLMLRQSSQSRIIMYRVFRQLACLNIAQENGLGLLSEQIFPDYKVLIDFILSCESPSGGFSHLPGEDAGMQPTYQALHLFLMLHIKVPHKEMHQSFLTKCFINGGFSGKVDDDISTGLFTYYGLMSLLLLDATEETIKKIDRLLFL